MVKFIFCREAYKSVISSRYLFQIIVNSFHQKNKIDESLINHAAKM